MFYNLRFYNYHDYYYGVLELAIILVFFLAIYAEFKVNYNFKKYSISKNRQGYTGAEIARKLLFLAGINDVKIKMIGGRLSDNYNPLNKTLNLSENVYNSTSLSAIGVAAHEAGHAIQHKQEYFPVVLRGQLFPIANFSSKLSFPLILFGLLFSRGNLFILNLGIALFAVAVVFQIITLPVEFDASKRAVKLLSENNFLDKTEVPGVKKVLSAAALTYIAATLAAVLNLIRYILISRDRRK